MVSSKRSRLVEGYYRSVECFVTIKEWQHYTSGILSLSESFKTESALTDVPSSVQICTVRKVAYHKPISFPEPAIPLSPQDRGIAGSGNEIDHKRKEKAFRLRC